MIEWTAMKRHLKVVLLLPAAIDQVGDYATPVAQPNLFIILKCLGCSLCSLFAYFGMGSFNFALGFYFIFWVSLTLIGSNNAEKKARTAKKQISGSGTNTPPTGSPREDMIAIFDQHELTVQATKYSAELFLNFCFEYFGFVWITGISYAVLLDRSGPQGKVLCFIVILANWCNDIFALIVGVSLKGYTRPLYPRISPNKSLEGAVAGTIANGFAWPILLWIMNDEDTMYWGQDYVNPYIVFFFLGILFGCFGVVGDLLQSLFKRTARIKDTGTFFPGHGGVLDRIDGLLVCYPLAWWMFWLFTRLVHLPGHNE
eukprot:GILI01023249.1.p1 GENE.GILI01023249.1~~GILI01023249.1.p1  ORF type:complete len:348 (+),score=50.75 GILI01023249.1:105-1046(+)